MCDDGGRAPNRERHSIRYERDLEMWREPARYTFSHVFLTDERSEEMGALVSSVSARIESRSGPHVGLAFLIGLLL
ncbi:MAG: hypothetical protein CM15mP74_06920 [Halieaceae bacterium]|nr:MAG: hypothetical protein CM15mP74_06920 [Halieaceae bacterium]